MTDRPCKLSVLVILSLPSAPYSEEELASVIGIEKQTLRVYLYRWQHYDGVIQKEEVLTGSPLYRLTPFGEEYLKKMGKGRKNGTPKVLSHA
jgi:hypothetical protein